jgi:hypothetical protein
MADTDETYYTYQWNGRPVIIESLVYYDIGIFGTYTMTFSDGSTLMVSGELGTQGGTDGNDPVVFFKWNEIFPYYTQSAYDSAHDRINDVANEHAQISSFSICHDTTSGHNDFCDSTLYINTDSTDIPYFGFRSTHNGYYSHEVNICYTDDIGNVIYKKRIML